MFFYHFLSRVEQSKKDAQAWSEHSLKVLETLAEAVGHDPFNIPPLMVADIRSFEMYVSETLAESIVSIYPTLHPSDSCLRSALPWNLPWSKAGYQVFSD
jgi:hypothetical protein